MADYAPLLNNTPEPVGSGEDVAQGWADFIAPYNAATHADAVAFADALNSQDPSLAASLQGRAAQEVSQQGGGAAWDQAVRMYSAQPGSESFMSPEQEASLYELTNQQYRPDLGPGGMRGVNAKGPNEDSMADTFTNPNSLESLYNNYAKQYNTTNYFDESMDKAEGHGGFGIFSQVFDDVAMAILAAGSAGAGAAAGAGAIAGGAAGGAFEGLATQGPTGLATGAIGGGAGGALGASVGGALGSQTAGQALVGAGLGAAEAGVQGKNALTSGVVGGLMGGASGAFGSGTEGTNVSDSGGSSSASGALASPTSGGDLTSTDSSTQSTSIPDGSTEQQSFAPGSDASTVANFLNPTSSSAQTDSGATNVSPTSDSGSSAGLPSQSNSSIAPIISAAIPAAATASLPSILGALGIGNAASGSATSAVAGGSGVQTMPNVASAGTTSAITPSITLTPDEMGMALTPDILDNPAASTYSSQLSSGGQLGYGSGSGASRGLAGSGLPSGYAVAQTAQDFGV